MVLLISQIQWTALETKPQTVNLKKQINTSWAYMDCIHEFYVATSVQWKKQTLQKYSKKADIISFSAITICDRNQEMLYFPRQRLFPVVNKLQE